MSGFITNAAGNAQLTRDLIAQPVWLGLARATPTALGNLSVEFAGNGYERVPCTWTTPANKTSALAAEVRITDNPDDVLRWYLICDSVAGGDILYAIERTLPDGETPDPLAVASNQEVRIPAGDLVIGPL